MKVYKADQLFKYCSQALNQCWDSAKYVLKFRAFNWQIYIIVYRVLLYGMIWRGTESYKKEGYVLLCWGGFL